MSKKKTGKLVSVGLVSAMLVLAAACSNSGNSGNQANQASPAAQNSEAATSTEPAETIDPMSKYEPALEISVARPSSQNWKYPQGDSLENNIWTREYENTLGIKVKMDWTAEEGATYDQKMNVAIASGNLPDIFVVNANQLQQLANAGQLADLTEIFDQYATPLTKELVNSDGGAALGAATFDGKLLAMPGVNANLFSPSLVWVRTDWLTKLNLPEPKTLQDLYAISEAFVNQDPDGNGKKDTLGLGLTKDLYGGGIGLITGFANGFHAYPNIWLKNEDGTAEWGSTKPEMKLALAKLQEMYKNGQIDQMFGVTDGGKIGESIAANKLGLMYGENWMPYYPIIDGKKQNPEMEWKPFAIPSVDGTPAKAGVEFATYSYTVVNKNFKNPEAIVKLLNVQQEKFYKAPRDPKSPYYSVQEGDTLIETMKYPVVQSGLGNNIVVESINLLKDAIANDDPAIASQMIAETDKFEPITKFIKEGNMDFWPQARQYDAFQVLIDMYNNGSIVTNVLTGQTKTMGDKWASLLKLEKETFTKIIMGAASVDEFDKFVETWNKLGGEEISKEVTERIAK